MKNWIIAIRPKTLSAAWIPVIAATALAYANGMEVNPVLVILSISASLLIQIATNLFNDVIDFKKGADSSKRLGPTRVTQNSLLKAQTVQNVAVLCLGLALVLSFPLLKAAGLPLLVLGLLSLYFAYGYTGGPFPLAYLGLGDIFVLLFFGFFAVLGSYAIHAQSWSFPASAFILALQIGLWATALIAINNLRDREEDQGSNKKTLAVRFGERFGKIEISFLLIAPYLIGIFYWSLESKTAAALLPLLSLPLAIKVIRGVWKNPASPIYNQYLAMAGATHLLSGLLITIGLIYG